MTNNNLIKNSDTSFKILINHHKDTRAEYLHFVNIFQNDQKANEAFTQYLCAIQTWFSYVKYQKELLHFVL